MSSTKANLNDIEKQELKDYKTASAILACIFKKYKKEFYKQESGSVYDEKMTVFLHNKKIRYHIEIKERTQNMKRYHTLPLTVQKYCNIKDTLTNQDETQKAIYISLLNGYQYYIFDLEKIDLNKCNIRNWAINEVEFCNNPTIKKVPTIFIPLNQCVCSGTYTKIDTNNWNITVKRNANNKQVTQKAKSTETTKTTTIQ